MCVVYATSNKFSACIHAVKMESGDLEAVELKQEHVLITDSEFGNCPLAVVQFIRDVRALPSIWDRNSPKYDTHDRRQSWTTLCRKSYPQFDDRSEFEKTLMVRKLKRKWKSLRDGYIRELSAMKNPNKSRRCKKPYVYFDNLTFLSDGSKAQREDNNEDDELNGEEDDDSEHTDYSIEQHWIKEEDDLSRLPEENQSSREESAESHRTLRTTKETPGTISNKDVCLNVGKALRLTSRSSQRLNQNVNVEASLNQEHEPARPKKRKTIKQYPDQSPSNTNKTLDTSSTEAMYIHETVAVEDNSARAADSDIVAREGRCCSYFCETDEDRLFLLSLVSELKQVPRDLKLDAKMEIMNVIKTYKSKINTSSHRKT